MAQPVGFQLRDQRRAVLDVYHRADTSVSSWHDAVIGRIEELERTGRIDQYHRHTWPRRVRLSTQGSESEIVGTFERFEEWASRSGTDLRTGFDVRTRRSTITGDRDAVVVLPEICIAVHEDGDLAGVVPHAANGAVYTVDDFLSVLERTERSRLSTPRQERAGSLGVTADNE